MPSEFLNPYSILEIAATRYLARFDSLVTYAYYLYLTLASIHCLFNDVIIGIVL